MNLSGKKIFLTGGMGMLASDLIPLLLAEGAELTITDQLTGQRAGQEVLSLDITQVKDVLEAVKEVSPAWVINCAAYTKVDQAETQSELAFLVNGRGVGNLAEAALLTKSTLVHLSTDYVFGGSGADTPRHVPYREEDVPAPCGVYGHSKRYGEELILEMIPDRHLMVRTAWLHGKFGPNFVSTMLRLGKEAVDRKAPERSDAQAKKEIKVVNDQVGSPTYSRWLARTMIELLKREARGTYHVTSKGNISWFDFAKEIFAQAGLEVTVVPQSTEELGRPAERPAFSTLDLTKVESFLDMPCITWQEGIREHLKALDQ